MRGTSSRAFAALLLFFLALTMAATSHAAVIIWGAGARTTAGDSDVDATGTLVGALNVGVGQVGDTTVNGVTFTGIALPNGGFNATSGDFTFHASSSLEGGYCGANSSLSPAYQTLLGSYGSCLASPMTLAISNLTVGREYEFEWWCSYSNSFKSSLTTATGDGGGAVTLKSNTTSAPNGVGQFAIGDFTADATSETISFSSGNQVNVNGVQLRDITVPEPSTGLAALLGLGVLLPRGRSRLSRNHVRR